MNQILKTILIIIIGIVLGMAANMGIVILSGLFFPFPEGFDLMDSKSFQEFPDALRPVHYIMAFLAHGVGTMVAAWFMCRFIDFKEKIFALAVGFFFLFAGIINLSMIPHPDWFGPLDLIGAYIPFALLGYFIAMKMKLTNE